MMMAQDMLATHDSAGARDGFKPREYRRPVIIEARMRSGGGWVTVCIRNISLHGLMAQTGTPPPPGTYIEIHRGAYTIVGRTVWSRGRKFGVRTQNALDVEGIISNPVPVGRGAARLPDGQVIADRRSDIRRPSATQEYEKSQLLSRRMQSLIFVAAGVCAAWLLAEILFLQLSDMATAVSKGLS
ncbi:PilZ domain-containing protein [Sphingobium phenoxybenzoativorans]|uniref:PilZ domain-containing protein n=1 Tax=Sphingobium phenoxybenzoativorans TaxID=1592790 RepID=UPI0008729642|nr:PilZ domain-containing protein [Sphingobium phenoxybenzoativorans]